MRRVTFAHISLNIAFSLPPAGLHVGGAGGTVARRPSRLLHLHTAPQNYQLDKIIHHTNKQWTQIGCLQCPNTFTTTCFPDLALCAKLLLGRHCCARLTSDCFHPFSSIALVCMYAVIITVLAVEIISCVTLVCEDCQHRTETFHRLFPSVGWRCWAVTKL